MNTTTQVAEIFNGLQASLGFRSKRSKRWCKQVTERLTIASSYTSTHLMQVAQAEILRSIDDNGIGIRDVDTTLNNGSR